MNHSCDPNVEILWENDPSTPLQANVIALKEIVPGDELVFSYIDNDLPYEQRQLKLRDYGFECNCKKCQARC